MTHLKYRILAQKLHNGWTQEFPPEVASFLHIFPRAILMIKYRQSFAWVKLESFYKIKKVM